jgi:glycosyltransferase involved in cell wall biosynthesis
MRNFDTTYDLVHVVGNGEHLTAVVASQVFDRAQAEATLTGNNRPASVSVWIMVPMRSKYNKKEKEVLAHYRQRCPNVNIECVGGVGRLGYWPSGWHLDMLRRKLGSKVVYHCRGESTISYALSLKNKYKDDAIILDVRGFWPLEKLANSGIYNFRDIAGQTKVSYDEDVRLLTSAVHSVDQVCTVSKTMKDYLIRYAGAPEDTIIIPCCVNNVVPDAARDKIRKQLDIAEQTAVLYLGGAQKWQHIDDLVVPFMYAAQRIDQDVVCVFITQHKDKMRDILEHSGIDMGRTRLISVPQEEVAQYLSAMDIGLLLRGPSDMNSASQPVKFGEYLSAGLPVILEKGTGNISEMLDEYGMGLEINLTGQHDKDTFDLEVKRVLAWQAANRVVARGNARRFVEECYTWKANMPAERKMYVDALGRRQSHNEYA